MPISKQPKNKIMIYKIDVEIGKITIEDNYYTFDYKVKINGKLKEKGEINDDFENGNTAKEQIKMLEEDEALNLVLIKVFE